MPKSLTKKEKMERYRNLLYLLEKEIAISSSEEEALRIIVERTKKESETGLSTFWWCGFYIYLKERSEVVLAESNRPACSPLPVAPRTGGVVSDAVLTEKPIIVSDVSSYPGHIYCDTRAKSEIVIPIFNSRDELVGVFDADSDELGSFDTVDREWLIRILEPLRRFSFAPLISHLSATLEGKNEV